MSSAAFREALVEAAPDYGLDLASDGISRFCRHFELLVTWNRKINLTRIVEPDEAARLHFLESAYLSTLVDAPARLIDVGSGAGFPGVPLACVWPDTQTVLVEPLVKRSVFLKEVVRLLALERVAIRNARFAPEIVDEETLVVARALDRFEALLPELLGSSARHVALFSEPDLLATAASIAPDRAARVWPLPTTTRRNIGIFSR